ncbi:homoserine kinase [Bacillus sp. KH172YL63]|uniref:homoserine kinase n=1 Tax=Bacillus sp. KH172YL63 TaxID=2709784 RepID=UPI0013E420CE|nr:homoserine kinase [Bacillus sp. KH172YL63]BCB02345.1 homoserine kinase [Bacillus sp. KH172YL63]
MRGREPRSFKITVPGSTANLGAGFDSLGLALNIFLTVEAHEAEEWKVIPLSAALEIFPSDDTHFIVEVAKEVAAEYGRKPAPCHLYVKSDIPLTRGLGSSAAAVVAGVELANALCGLNLSLDQKLSIANRFEGHPDNVGASLYGGFVVSCQHEKGVGMISVPDLPIDVVCVIPKDELKTSDSRNVLPSTLSFGEAVGAGAISNVLVAAFLTGDWETAGKMMKRDRYHQPYRKKLIPHYEAVEEVANRFGAFGTALSGAGPTIACFVEREAGEWLFRQLEQSFPRMDVRRLSIAQSGSTITNVQPKVRPSSL